MTRDQALEIVTDHVTNQNLVKHMLAVEAAMAAYAKKYSQDEQRWALAGLLHDFDWEIHPTLEEHPQKGALILHDRGVDENLIQDILSHADHTGVPRNTLLKKALFACDELTGFIVAVTLVRPSKKLADVKVSSVKKKLKDKAFARAVKREDVTKGAQKLGVNLNDHIHTVLTAMQQIAPDLGL